ncbi:leucine-rich repeat domain-containing protein [Flavobacterium ardleyense]|uniref:Leucine-rich repeat domain-containing protein n=1 Tax=Flavobacterium ardleyense TaxID=2038737 RepID=A0ABW5Z6H0_9FLAO
MIFPLSITLTGYAVFGLLLLSFYLSYNWLKRDTDKKPGCLSVGITSVILFFILMFPVLFSISFYESGSQPVKIGIASAWILLIGFYLVAKISNKTKSFWSVILTILKYFLFTIVLVLFCILYFGMFYYVYKIIFTNQEPDFQLWAGFLCVFFTSVLTFILLSLPLIEKGPKGASTFYALNKALKKPEIVTRLDLKASNLTEFPMEVLRMPNLQYLELSQNNITDIPLEIKQLYKLQDLYLRNNPISVASKVRLRREFPNISINF